MSNLHEQIERDLQQIKETNKIIADLAKKDGEAMAGEIEKIKKLAEKDKEFFKNQLFTSNQLKDENRQD